MIKESDKISVEIYSTNNEYEHFANLFQEDLINFVNRYNTTYTEITCRLEKEDLEFERIIKNLLPNYRGISNNQLKDKVFDAAQKIMAHLVKNGYALFEVVKQIDLNENEEYKLIAFNSSTFKIENEDVIQSFQNKDQKKIEIRIKKNKCLIANFPQILGNIEEYFAFLQELGELDKSFPTVILGDQKLSTTKGYDFYEHKRLIGIDKLILNKKYYWSGRRYQNELLTGFNGTKMQLEFKKLQIQLRDYVVSILLDYIESFANKLGTPNKIIIEGMPSVSEIDDTIRKWEMGEISRSELSSILY